MTSATAVKSCDECETRGIQRGQRQGLQVVFFRLQNDCVFHRDSTRTQHDSTKSRKILERFQKTSGNFTDACRLEPELQHADEFCRLDPKEQYSDEVCCILVSF